MNYWETALKPCKIADELYYVGNKKGPTHLLVTKDGLVLIDTGYPQTTYLLLDNILKLGFDYHDIRHIIHTHAHLDHVGGTRALAELTGAKTYIGFGDEEAASAKNELIWANEFNREYEEPFSPDVIIYDGDCINFGDTQISFMSTPGHTMGTMSLFFNVHSDGQTYRAGMFGGAGLNSLTKKYMLKYNLPTSLRTAFIESIDKALKEKVDIHLGNHINDNEHLQKMALIGQGENPFLRPTWSDFLTKKKEAAIKLFDQASERM